MNDSGHYIYIETATTFIVNATARISSPVLKATKPKDDSCKIRFWYHMYGIHINALTLYTRTELGGDLTTVWGRDYEHGDEWFRAEVTLKSDKKFQVFVFQNEIYKSYYLT